MYIYTHASIHTYMHIHNAYIYMYRHKQTTTAKNT